MQILTKSLYHKLKDNGYLVKHISASSNSSGSRVTFVFSGKGNPFMGNSFEIETTEPEVINDFLSQQ